MLENRAQLQAGSPQPHASSKSPGWAARIFGHKKPPASIPHGCRVYAVGDVHGRLDLLVKLWAAIEADAAQADLHKVVVFVGDYVDRGRDSKGVIEFLMHARLKGGETVCLRGNHDQSVLDFVADAGFYRGWKTFGAPETLLSYGVMPPRFDDDASLEAARSEFVRQCPPGHLKFLDSLRYSYMVGDYFFSHAGARPGISLEEQDHNDLMWIREDFLGSRKPFEKIIVYGHTPVQTATRHSARIGIDTGAYATDCLTAVILEGTGCRFLTT